jgi:hypothetical protein
MLMIHHLLTRLCQITPCHQILIDAVLCHGLDIYAWNHFPYVGAPWENHIFCLRFPSHWNNWHSNAKEYQNKKKNQKVLLSSSPKVAIPDYPNDMCTNPETAPLGNGGLTLRSRYWMQQAIWYCPIPCASGLSQQEVNDDLSPYQTGK